MKFTPKRRVLSTLLGGKVDKIPVTSISGCGGTVCLDMQKAIKIYWPEGHKDAAKMAKLAIASSELTGLESVRVPFDFVVEAEALGCDIRWYDRLESVPSVAGHPYQKPDDLKMPDNLKELGRIPIVLEAIRKIRNEVGDTYPISSLALGPFSIAADLVGVSRLLKWVIKKPNWVKKFVNFAKDITIEYAKAQYQAGSDIVEVGDPMASGEMISQRMFNEFVKPALTEITNNLGGIRVLHICGYTRSILQEMAEIGFDGLSVEEDNEIANLRPFVGNVRIMGNVSSKKTLVFGSPIEVKKEAKRALEAGIDLLEPSCGISPITPLKNIRAMVEARDEFYV